MDPSAAAAHKMRWRSHHTVVPCLRREAWGRFSSWLNRGRRRDVRTLWIAKTGTVRQTVTLSRTLGATSTLRPRIPAIIPIHICSPLYHYFLQMWYYTSGWFGSNENQSCFYPLVKMPNSFFGAAILWSCHSNLILSLFLAIIMVLWFRVMTLSVMKWDRQMMGDQA